MSSTAPGANNSPAMAPSPISTNRQGDLNLSLNMIYMFLYYFRFAINSVDNTPARQGCCPVLDGFEKNIRPARSVWLSKSEPDRVRSVCYDAITLRSIVIDLDLSLSPCITLRKTPVQENTQRTTRLLT
jgi:hypothetical protein